MRLQEPPPLRAPVHQPDSHGLPYIPIFRIFLVF